MDKLVQVGAVIQGKQGSWTIMGTPKLSHTSTFDGKPVYKVAAYWEGKDGSHGPVCLTLHADDAFVD